VAGECFCRAGQTRFELVEDIWAGGFLPLCLNMLYSVMRTAPEVAAFLNQFESRLARATEVWHIMLVRRQVDSFIKTASTARCSASMGSVDILTRIEMLSSAYTGSEMRAERFRHYHCYSADVLAS
jgi:hypothetical protein